MSPNKNYENVSIPRSHLYELEPIQAYGQSECLTGYVKRLSNKHGVPVGAMLRQIFATKLNKPYLNRILQHGGSRFFAYSKSLNGFGQGAKNFVQILQSVTGLQNLTQLTLLPLAGVLSVRYLFRSTLTWCPVCFETMLQNRTEIFEPLLWTLRIVEVCPIHEIRLVSQCPHCKHNLYMLERDIKPGYCRCGQWLGSIEGSRMLCCQSEQDFALKKSRALSALQLIQANLDFARSSLRHSSQEIIGFILTEFGCNIPQLGRVSGIPEQTLRSWYSGKVKISLPHLLQLADRLNIPTDTLLKMDGAFEAHRPIVYTVHPTTTRHIVPSISTLQAYLEDAEHRMPPPSLQQVAHELSVDRKLLRNRFPDLSRQIVVRYRSYQISKRDERLANLTSDVKDAIQQLYRNGIYPSRRRVEQTLQRPGLLHELKLQEIWASELKKYLVDKI